MLGMSRRWHLVLLFALAASACSSKKAAVGVAALPQKLQYPTTRTVDHVDSYHGIDVRDPYRWLEDDNSEETKAWVVAQNRLTRDYLATIQSRDPIRARIAELQDYERRGVPDVENGRYFFNINTGLQEQAVLHMARGVDADPTVLLDPNKLSTDKTVSQRGRWFTQDGKLMAYGISRAGSDWREIHVMDVDSGKELAIDALNHIKFSGASWTPDNYGFYYSRFPKPEEGKQLTGRNTGQAFYFHRLGTPQTEDQLVFKPKDPDLAVGGFCTRDGSYLLLYLSRSSSRKSAVYVQDRDKGTAIRPLFDHFEDEYTYIANDGPIFYFLTDRDAPKRRIVAIDIENPAQQNWREIVPQAKDPISDVIFVGGRFVIEYLHLARSKLVIHRVDGALEREVELPTLGSVYALKGKPDHNEFFFLFTSFTYPSTVYRYDLEENELDEWFEPDVDFSGKDYTVKQVAYKSTKDGQHITMFIVHKRKRFKLNGDHPTMLYGYGGFNVSLKPGFSPSRIVWLEMGGVYAMANLRGGGEYGEKWHRAGMLENKQRVFDDFIDAAKALFHNGYTSPRRLAIAGGSNGGLLVGACLTQRPRLFGACLPAVGVLDMLRFHKFTVGRHWVGEYGSSDDPDMFKVLQAYSPYHNIKQGVNYPPTMVTTGDHDDRVVPAHSFKFAARLQAAQGGPAPILIRIETSGGHGGGTALSKRIDATADRYAFLARNLRMKLPRAFR